MKTLLGIDCGTQSTKTVVYDPEIRRVVGSAQASHDLLTLDGGIREQEAQWWVDALGLCLKSLGPDLLSTVSAIGVSGQQHGFVPVDAEGRVLTRVKLWCDTSTSRECGELTRAAGGADALFKAGGNPILPGYTASKILWFKKNHSDLYARMSAVLLPHDYLNFVLTGNRVTEFGDASGTGLLDVRKRRWSQKLVRALDKKRDLSPCFPALIAAHKPAGRMTAAAAAMLGLPAGIPVSSGGGDNMMAALGTGVNREGAFAASLGTSGTLFGFSKKPVADRQGAFAAFCSSSGGWLPLLCTMNCTVATELTRGVLDVSLDDLEALAGQAPPGAGGVVTLPFYNGERVPNLPGGKGCILGLTPTNFTPANLVRSAMESAIFGLKYGLEAFKRQGLKPKLIRLTGGGAKSPLWRQMAADIFEVPVACPVQEEAAAFGAALQALWCLQRLDDPKADLNHILDEHVAMDSGKGSQPDKGHLLDYRKTYEQYLRYLKTIKPHFL